MTKMRKKNKKGLREDGLSNYARKKILQEQGETTPFTQEQEEASHSIQSPQQKQYAPQELSRFPSLEASTYTSYIANSEQNPIVIIRPSSRSNTIYSLVISEHSGHIIQAINKRGVSNFEKRKITQVDFAEFYKDSWINENRTTQCELHAIEQTIQSKKKSIEDHLGAKLS